MLYSKLLYDIYMLTAKQNQKFPFHSFRFAVEGWGEETREKCKEIFWFLHTRVRERVRGAHHWSSGFNSKYIRTSFNTHRNFSKRVSERKMGSARSADPILGTDSDFQFWRATRVKYPST